MPFTPPLSQTAIIAIDGGKLIVSHDVPVVEIEADEVLVKTAAVALNPVDTKMIGPFCTPGAILGFDFAGTVIAVGKDVKEALAPGDRICGSADGMNPIRPLAGAFAQYIPCAADLCLKLPKDASFEASSAFGTALVSAGVALFYSLKLPATPDKPAKTPFWVLVNGGSITVGTMATQLIKESNLRPIVTCSSKNFDFVKSFGAEAVFDYNSPTCSQDIRAHTKNALAYALDCITEDSSMKLCYEAIGRAGGNYTALDMDPELDKMRKVVKPDWTLATDVKGKPNLWPAPYKRDPNPELRPFGKALLKTAQRLWDEGKIRPHRTRVGPGGFHGVLDCIEILRRKEVSGEKLV